MDKKAKAAELHKSGYNCAQAVVCAFAEEAGIDEATAFRMSEAFGLGMGGMQCTCGAVSGAMMLAGLLHSKPEEGGKSKAATYKASRDIPAKFIAKNGSAVCSELKGVDTGKVLRSCPGCIEDAVELVHEVLGI